MNLMVVDKSLVDYIKDDFIYFLEHMKNPLTSEYGLPAALLDTIRKDMSNVKLLKTSSKWYGMTYREDLEELKKAFNEINNELNKEVLRIKDKKYTLIEYYDVFYNKNKTGSDEYNSLIKAKEKKIKSILGKYLKYDDNMYDLLKNDSYINLLEETVNKKSAYYSIVKADYNYFKESNKYILSIYETTIKKYINLTDIALKIGR